jgi:Ca2+-binding RTX toxin-like protein
VGTERADNLTGTEGPDVIVGLGKADSINGMGGDDRICGKGTREDLSPSLGEGNDQVKGVEGDDHLMTRSHQVAMIASGGPRRDWFS